jgi:hypothetical protein
MHIQVPEIHNIGSTRKATEWWRPKRNLTLREAARSGNNLDKNECKKDTATRHFNLSVSYWALGEGVASPLLNEAD